MALFFFFTFLDSFSAILSKGIKINKYKLVMLEIMYKTCFYKGNVRTFFPKITVNLLVKYNEEVDLKQSNNLTKKSSIRCRKI